MPRKKLVLKKRQRLDPIYQNAQIGRLIGKILVEGKRIRAEQIVYSALDTVAQKTGKTPVEVMETVIDKCRPRVEVKPRRVGGATYQVPLEVTVERGEALAIKWIVMFSRKRSGMPMRQRLASEMADSLAGQGGAYKKKEDTHKMAEANKAFAHYHW
ncbi:30S ribosomal protein S7 [bacterium]|nr:30S ribosomal protein S7 [bacterium]